MYTYHHGLSIALSIGIVVVVCASGAVGEEKHWGKDDAFDQWQKKLPPEFGYTSRDFSRLQAAHFMARNKGGRAWDRVTDEKGDRLVLKNASAVSASLAWGRPTTVRWIGPEGLFAAFLHDPHYDPSVLGIDRDGLKEIVRQLATVQIEWFKGREREEGKPVHCQAMLWLLALGKDILEPAQTAYLQRALEEGKQHAVMHQVIKDDPDPGCMITLNWGWGPVDKRDNMRFHRHLGKGTGLDQNCWVIGHRNPYTILLKKLGGPKWETVRPYLYRDHVNSCSTIHLAYCTEKLEGKEIREWATGHAFSRDFMSGHHGDYPNTIYGRDMILSACLGAGLSRFVEGDVPRIYMYNFDYLARWWFMPLTLWRDRLWGPSDDERRRFGECCDYKFRSLVLPTYLKIRHKDPRAARWQRNCLAFNEWVRQRGLRPVWWRPGQHDNEYCAEAVAQVQVEPSNEEELQRWLSGTRVVSQWSTDKKGLGRGMGWNRTPRRFVQFGGDSFHTYWAVIPRNGDWMYSMRGVVGKSYRKEIGEIPRGSASGVAYGLYRKQSIKDVRFQVFGGGFGAVGRKQTGLSRHAMAALPDECTVVVFSQVAPDAPPEAASEPGLHCNLEFDLLSTPVNEYKRDLYHPGGHKVLKQETVAGRLNGPWLNIDDRIGYVVVYPSEGSSFAHGVHPKCQPGSRTGWKREARVPVWFPNGDKARSCMVMVCDQSSEGTRAYVEKKGARWIETGHVDLMAAWVKGRDGTDYLVTANTGKDSRKLRVELEEGEFPVACILGEKYTVTGRKLDLVTAAGSMGMVQVGWKGKPAGVQPHVRLLAPDPAPDEMLESIFLTGGAYELKAEAVSLDGVKEVRFMVRQGGIFEPPRVLAVVKNSPYNWKWRFEDKDRGRYAEIWAEAVSEGGLPRESTHIQVMVTPADAKIDMKKYR